MPKFTSRFRRPAFAAVLLAATAVAGLGAWQVVPAFAQGTAASAPSGEHTAPIDTARPAAQALPGFADLVERVSPAVVTISTTLRQQEADQASPFPPNSPQDRMFGQFFGGHGQGRGQGQDRAEGRGQQGAQAPGQVVHALGSGFIIDDSGRIVTNNHVVQDATDIQVTLADGRKLAAKVVGVDPKTDLAVLQVTSATKLPHLALGDSNAARVGDWVVAVGNPFGLGGTVTAGILSARGREIGQGPYDDFLQIDAPINRGNSGGPLFAQDGTVIGVNTAIYSPSGGSVGIGFAIPASVVKQVVGQLQANGHVERGWLGVSTQSVTPPMARALHLTSPAGAMVAEVQNDSPAKLAGIEAGDVIVKVGSQDIKTPRELARIVADTRAGTEQPVVVHRDGADKTLSVKVTAVPDPAGTRQAEVAKGPQLGLALAPLDDQARQELGLPAGQKGVVIAQVQPDSPAANAGLRDGDVLEMVGNQAVSTPEQAVRALRAGTRAPGSAVALRVMRDGHQAFVALSQTDANAG